MIDIQTISIVLAASRFILAATYYVFNLKHQRESREATLFNSISQSLFSQERWRERADDVRKIYFIKMTT
jgi:hypothetical protein